MNPMYLKIASSLIRYALVAAGVEGFMSDDELTQGIGAVVTFGTLAWSVWKNYKERQVLVTALKVASASEHTVKALVADPSTITPSVTTPADVVPV